MNTLGFATNNKQTQHPRTYGAINETRLAWRVECADCRGNWLWSVRDESQAHRVAAAHADWSHHHVTVAPRNPTPTTRSHP